MAQRLRNITSQRFGSLLVLGLDRTTKPRRYRWLCLCDCGRTKTVLACHLARGDVKTCNNALCPFSRNLRFPASPDGDGPRKQVWRMYTARAERKGWDFELSQSTFFGLLENDCYYCGAKPFNKSVRGSTIAPYYYNGIDRIEPTRGYVMGNVRTCCWICNRMKSNIPETEFLNRVRHIYQHLCS